MLDSFPRVKYSDAFEILHIFVFGQVISIEQKTLFNNLFLSSREKLEQYFKDIGQIRTEFASIISNISISDEEILKLLNLVNVINDRTQKLYDHLTLNINELQNYYSNPNKLDELVEQFFIPKEVIIKDINTILEKLNSHPNFNQFMSQPPQFQNNPNNPNQNPYFFQQQNFPMNQPPFLNPNEFNNPNFNPFMNQSPQPQNNLYNPNQNSYFPHNLYMSQPPTQSMSNNPNQYPYPQNNYGNPNYNQYQNPNLSYMNQSQVPNNWRYQYSNPNSNFPMSQPPTQSMPNNPNQYPYSQNNYGNPNYNQYSNPNLPHMNQPSNYSQILVPNISHSQNPNSIQISTNDSNPFINSIYSAMLLAKRKFDNDIKSLKSNMEAIKNSNELSTISDTLNSSEQQLKSYIDSILDILNKNEHDDNAQTKLKVIMEIYKKSNLNVKDINSSVLFLTNLSEIYPIRNESEKQTNNNDVKLLKETLESIKKSQLLKTVAETLDLSREMLISYMASIINMLAQENINENIQNLNEAVKNLDIEDSDSIIECIIVLLKKYPLDEMTKEVNNNNNQQNEDKTINLPFIFSPNDLKEENNNANINDNEEKIKSILNQPPIFSIPNPNDSKKDYSAEDEIKPQAVNIPTDPNQFSALDFEELLNSHNANSENQQPPQTKTPEKSQEKQSIFNRINDKSKNEDVPKCEPNEKSQGKE